MRSRPLTVGCLLVAALLIAACERQVNQSTNVFIVGPTPIVEPPKQELPPKQETVRVVIIDAPPPDPCKTLNPVTQHTQWVNECGSSEEKSPQPPSQPVWESRNGTPGGRKR